MRNIVLLTALMLCLWSCKNKPLNPVPVNKSIATEAIEDEPCKDTCYGQFKRLYSEQIGNTLYVYLSGDKVDLMKDCCQYMFGEIAYNTLPSDTTTRIIKIFLLDLTSFEGLGIALESASDDIKRKAMCQFTYDKKTQFSKIIPDPFQYGLYKYPKDWGQ